ncbi:MAG TPA: hypothetical protein PKL17_09480 [Pseudomonadota bacterium]|nr:hypothetical protein [Pseudomonadota bacterium]HND11637.1 hypothetical protein [Pseudomonadota bacterium]HNF96082.1 hypothetical protein [Pseudomonadota bacterium]HNK45002.1 hypothetical protein [Pseudomonadota bacterium]HNN49636.1 hypothetical protein [Pseudomonadota bacterium]
MSERLEELLRFVELMPQDPFPLYGLALEYRSVGKFAESAAAFERLLASHPAYVPQYLMYGKLLAGELANVEKAREVLVRGIERARQAGNRHALGELQSELDAL